MSFELILRFRKSRSSSYPQAIKHAKKFDHFSEAESNKALNSVRIASDELKTKLGDFDALLSIVQSWKGTEILLDDSPIDATQLNQISKTIKCNSEYFNAVIQEDHCKLAGRKEGWGCKWLKSIIRSIGSNYYYYYGNQYYWYQFGFFKADKIWQIDKKKILDILNRETRLARLDLCSVFSFEKVEKIVESLPDEIDLQNSEHWEIEFEENDNGSTIEKCPIGIKPKNRENETDNVFGLRMSIGSSNEERPEGQKPKVNKYIPKVTYEDIGGMDEILQKIREVIEIPLKNPDLFTHLGIKPHMGILLYGPPGCGKTLIAKAIAHQVQAHFISVKGPELISKWHGHSEENLRNIFVQARELAPSIIFFDEIDAIAQRRSSDEQLRMDAKFVNQLLTLMDGVENYSNVRVIATTNRVQLLDEALLRPGRFDYHIQVNKPNQEGCYKVFRIQTATMPITKDFDKKYFSERLCGLTGAEIAYVSREGAYNCLRRALRTQMLDKNFNFENIDRQNLEIVESDFINALKMMDRIAG